MPTVVPGPKKLPSEPPGARRSFRLRIGRVDVQAAFRQISVTLPASTSAAGTGSAPMSPTKLLPGFWRFSRLKNSAKGLMESRSLTRKFRLTRKSIWARGNATQLVQGSLRPFTTARSLATPSPLMSTAVPSVKGRAHSRRKLASHLLSARVVLLLTLRLLLLVVSED